MLLIANVIPRKNVAGMLRCLGRLSASGQGGWQLAIVGNLSAKPAHTQALREQTVALNVSIHIHIHTQALREQTAALGVSEHVERAS